MSESEENMVTSENRVTLEERASEAPSSEGVVVAEIIGNPEADEWLENYKKHYEEVRK